VTSWIPTDLPDDLKNRLILNSHFTEEEHNRRIKKVCGGCNCGDFDKYHKCIHTAECTYELLIDEGELLPLAESVDVKVKGTQWGSYLLYVKPLLGGSH